MSTVLDTMVSADLDVTAKVSALSAGFRDRIAVSETQQSVPRESIDDLVDAGVARLLVPREHGGLDLGMRDLVEVTAAAAAGCAATGWLAGLMAHAAHVIGTFPREAQDAVWAGGPDVVAASSFMGAKAEAVPGGYRISGVSPFSSGVNNADWVYLAAMVVREGQPAQLRLFLLPKSDYTVRITWDTAGMRGTGSNTVVTDDVFVPEGFTIGHADAREGTAPGSRVNANPRFGLPWVATGALVFSAAMLGATEGVHAGVLASVRQKRAPNGKRVAESEVVQMQVSAAAARIAAARRTLLAMADRADRSADYTLEERAEIMRDGAYTASVIVEAIDTLLEISGTAGFGTQSFVQQAWRDVHFAAAHQGLSQRATWGRYGRVVLGVEETQPPVFY